MPELPEVETVCRSLRAAAVGLSVSGITTRRRDVIDGPARPRDLLAGAVITGVRRHGKRFTLIAHDARALELHLGMSGQVLLLPPGASAPSRADDPHTHLVWRLSAPDGAPRALMLFRDPRRFGGARPFTTERELLAHWRSTLGPDALDEDPLPALTRARSSASAIKARLLDQRVLAGVGNIYADEALFEARIAPQRPARSLSDRETLALANALRSVLTRAVAARGSTLRDYRNADGTPGSAVALHRVYARAGLPCTSCGTRLTGTLVAQRTTVWCPGCQT